MNIEQMIYTSCKKGLGAGPGFQTQAMSPGMLLDQRTALEQLPPYRYPRRLPTHPTAIDVERYCPPNLQLTMLDNGYAAVTRSVYTGTDYSGRLGNFLAHSLVLPPDTDIWPIDLVDWTAWQDEVAEEPPQLPSLQTSELEVGHASCDFKSLSEFVRMRLDRCEQLAAMLDTLLVCREESRPLIVRDDGVRLASWVACLTKLLPRDMTPAFTFATFVNARLANVDIQCTTPDSDLVISSEERLHRAYIFDFVDQCFPQIDQRASGLGLALAIRLRDHPDWFPAFHRFAGKYRIEVDARHLRGLVDCFALCEANTIHSSDLSGHSGAAVRFAARVCDDSDEGRALMDTILERLAARVNRGRESPSSVLQSLGVLLTSGCLDRPIRERVHRMLVRFIHDDLGRGGGDWQELLSACDRIAGDGGLSWEDLEPLLLSPDALVPLATAPERNQYFVNDLVKFLTGCVGRNKPASVEGRLAFHETVWQLSDALGREAIVDPLLAMLAREAPGEFELLCGELLRDADESTNLSIGRNVANALDGPLAPRKDAVRQSFLRGGRQRALLAELQHRANEINNGMDCFSECLTSLQTLLGKRESLALLPCIASAWQQATPVTRANFAEYLFGHLEVVRNLDYTTAGEIAETLAATISLNPRDRSTAEQEKVIRELCATAGMGIPVRIVVRDFLQRALRRKFGTVAEVYDEWTSMVQQVDKDLGDQVVDQALLPLLALPCSPIEHSRILVWACDIAHFEVVVRRYCEVLESGEFARIPPDAAGAFAVLTLAPLPKDPELRQLSRCADQRLDAWLAALPKRTFELVQPYVKAYDAQIGRNKFLEWDDRRAQARRRRNSVFQSILRLVGLRTWP